jgi:hypothetical protein
LAPVHVWLNVMTRYSVSVLPDATVREAPVFTVHWVLLSDPGEFSGAVSHPVSASFNR